jgi:hypothetical protein
MLELFPGTTYQIGKLSIRQMITSKAQMLRIMKDCDGADTLTREQKFQVFCKATHKRFTEIW